MPKNIEIPTIEKKQETGLKLEKTVPKKKMPVMKVIPAIDVQLYIPQMACKVLSKEEGFNNDRDEVYIQFYGQSPASLEAGRLPHYVGKDSYYEFWVGDVKDGDANWTNHDQVAVGRPVIWSGTLPARQSADFVITVMEQDAGSTGKLKKALDAGFNAAAAAFNDNEDAKTAIAAARELAKNIPDLGHEFIGAFAVRLTNDVGKLKTTFVPIQGAMTPASSGSPQAGIAKREKAQAVLFDLVGASGVHYQVIPAARIGAVLPVRHYISTERDKCGDTLLAVEGGPGPFTGFYHVAKGQEMWVPIANPRFAWYCGTSKEWATAPKGTNVVRVQRGGGDSRDITWYCYNEQGVRPEYKPTATRVRLSTETDQCSAPRLAVEGVGGFYHLAKGNSKWVPLMERRFRWYCDISAEYATAPPQTNLVRAVRHSTSREITWECYREIVSVKPFTVPDGTKVLIARETDQCGEENLFVLGDGGFYIIRKGQERWVPISNVRFDWLCGRSLEHSTAPAGTNLLLVKRHPTAREITWLCHRSLASTAAYKKPDTNRVHLGTETDQCGESKLTVDGAKGKVTIAKGQSAEVPVKANRFRWWCGSTEEFTTAPPRTNLVKVSRASKGREITWTCYLQR